MRYILSLVTFAILSFNATAVDVIGSAYSGMQTAADIGQSLITGAKTIYDNRCKICNRESCRVKKVGQLCRKMCRHKDVIRFGKMRIQVYSSQSIEKCMRMFHVSNKDDLWEEHERTNRPDSKEINIMINNEMDAEILSSLITDLFQANRDTDEVDEKLKAIISFSDDQFKNMADPEIYRSYISRGIGTIKAGARKVRDRAKRFRDRKSNQFAEEDMNYENPEARKKMSRSKRARISTRQKTSKAVGKVRERTRGIRERARSLKDRVRGTFKRRRGDSKASAAAAADKDDDYFKDLGVDFLESDLEESDLEDSDDMMDDPSES